MAFVVKLASVVNNITMVVRVTHFNYCDIIMGFMMTRFHYNCDVIFWTNQWASFHSLLYQLLMKCWHHMELIQKHVQNSTIHEKWNCNMTTIGRCEEEILIVQILNVFIVRIYFSEPETLHLLTKICSRFNVFKNMATCCSMTSLIQNCFLQLSVVFTENK